MAPNRTATFDILDDILPILYYLYMMLVYHNVTADIFKSSIHLVEWLNQNWIFRHSELAKMGYGKLDLGIRPKNLKSNKPCSISHKPMFQIPNNH